MAYYILVTLLNLNYLETIEQSAQNAMSRSQHIDPAKLLEHQYQLITDTIPAVVSYIDTTHTYQFVNKSFLDWFNMDKKDVIGRTVEEAWGKDTYEDVRGHIEKALRGEKLSFAKIIEIPGKEPKYTSIDYTPHISEDGKVLGIISLVNDITQIKTVEIALLKSEAQLRESKAVLQATFDNVPVGIAQTTPDGKWVSFNQKYCDLFGYTAEEMAAKKIRDLSAPEEYDLDIDYTQKLISGQIKSVQREKKYRRKNGDFFWGDVSASMFNGIDGKPDSFLVVLQDVSEKKAASEEKNRLVTNERVATETSKLKSDLLANMSHEIRTPMNGVIGLSNILLDTPLDAQQKEYVQMIKSSGDSLLNIINNILDFSKIEAGKQPVERIDFNLNDVVKDTVEIFSFVAHQKGLDFSFSLAPDLPTNLRGDPGKIRQLLNNLVSNALKFTENGRVEVQVKKVRTTTLENKIGIRFDVTDTGIGIPEHLKPKMFSPFSQADDSSTRKYGGTGLGLSICKKLVELMEGQIDFDRQRSKGSHFWIEILFDVSQKALTNESKHEFKKEAPRRNARVILAEDNSVNQIIAVALIEKMGFQVDTVENGKELLEAIRKKSYDLIFMDCQMPEMDGYEATKIIRQSDSVPFQQIPIIAMTASAIKGDREKCLAAGMSDYISKPLEPEALSTVLDRWIPPISRN